VVVVVVVVVLLKIVQFLDLEARSQRATLVVLLVVVIHSLKIPKAF